MNFLRKRLEILDKMDPSRIYVENVRAFLGVNTRFAGWICRKACRDGLLEQWVSFEHPDLGNSLYECPADAVESDSQKTIINETAEALGYSREYKLSELRRVEFFKKGS